MPSKTSHHPGRWSRALVTGASSGIGECIARRLAVRGCELILVARRRERLEALALELHSRSGAPVDVLGADLIRDDDLRRVEQRLRSTEAPVDLLVNNAGGVRIGVFPAGDEDYWIRLNIVAPVRLAAAVIPIMRQRSRGTILNISSGAAFHPHPYAAVYGGTKAFVNSFSEAIREENRRFGITVTAVCPGFTATELPEQSGFDVARMPRSIWADPDAIAGRAIAAAERDAAMCVPGWFNKLDAAFGYYAPRWLVTKSVASAMRRMSRDPLK